MKVYGKSVADQKLIDIKLRQGVDGIELHLPNEVLPAPDILIKNKVKVIHMPLIPFEDYSIESGKCFITLSKVADLAEEVAKAIEQNVIIVLHCGSSKAKLEHEARLDVVRARLISCVESHPNVELALENVTPVKMISKYKHVLRNALPHDTVSVALYCNHERIGTVLDICHARMTDRFYRILTQQYYEYWCPNGMEYTELHDFFVANAPVIKLIHLAWCVGDGEGENHGTPIEDQTSMDQVLSLYRKLHYNCPITIEVREDDYVNDINFRKTYKTLKRSQFFRMNE